MEQHYIIIFGMAGESAYKTYTICIIIPKYPGKPYELLEEIKQTIEDSSVSQFGVFIKGSNIAIKSLTRVF